MLYLASDAHNVVSNFHPRSFHTRKQNLINKALSSNLLFIHTNVVTHLPKNLPEDTHAFTVIHR